MGDMLFAYDFYGDGLKVRREKAGLTIAELSELSGISISQICKYESDKSKPSIDNAILLYNVIESKMPLSTSKNLWSGGM